MPRTPGVPGGRTQRVSTALSEDEAKDLDERRGPLDRSQFLRFLITKARKEDVRFDRKV